jgi:hypothetical protein
VRNVSEDFGRGRVWSAAPAAAGRVLLVLSEAEGPPLLRCSGNCESPLQKAGATTASESAEGSSLRNLSGVRESARAEPKIKKAGGISRFLDAIFYRKSITEKTTFRRGDRLYGAPGVPSLQTWPRKASAISAMAAGALCWVPAFLHCGCWLMLQKNPETESVRN